MNRYFLLLLLLCSSFSLLAQEGSAPYAWKAVAHRKAEGRYTLRFETAPAAGWQLYAPGDLGGVAAAELQLPDSSIRIVTPLKAEGAVQQVQSELLGTEVALMGGSSAVWTTEIQFTAGVPQKLTGQLLYTYGRGDEFYPATPAQFSVELEGGQAAGSRILIPAINQAAPVRPCGDEAAGGKGWATIFFLGLGAGLLALLFPCVFPLIPLTVSFFTKRSKTRRAGLTNAILYGGSIFLIYALLSLPFHLLNVQPEVLNNISTNVPLNLIFFAVFVAFAISFFGVFEITLPSSFANVADSRSGLGNAAGIFFMALTLAIVSFSCTSGILGALIVGALDSEGGAWQLTAGMSGFGLGLGLPFVLFALFPGWLQSLPKSGGWMNELKAVFGFIELAMAVKFLSNADLVKQWHLLEREVFIGLWVLIGLATVLYLCGVIRFPGDSKVRFTPVRIFFILLFGATTAYLVPGVSNTRSANLTLISGFPPPLCYSVYTAPVNCTEGVEPLHDYDEALAKARREGKPLLIDFTGWACVNCRRMEEQVWVNPEVKRLMEEEFVVVSLYVDERKALPVAEQTEYRAKNGSVKNIVTVGDKWATFQSENFGAVAQPQYAILSPAERALTRTKAYTPDAGEFAAWLRCGLEAMPGN